MVSHPEVDQLAAYLRMLKDRTGRSFDALGRRAGISGSSLHRYCAGSTVPTGFEGLFAFGKVCGATRDELRELQRLWVLADARRDVPSGIGDAPSGLGDAAALDPPTSDGAVTWEDHTDDAVGPVRGRHSRVALLAAAAVTILLAVTAWTAWPGRSQRAGPPATTGDDRLLFSPACHEAVSQGQNDECVREVQRLLKQSGGRLAVDGSFGPETLRRVTAFQVLAGLPPRGIVDDATKRALYDQNVSMATWPAAQVEQRIREVFVEEPDRAVAIADCQSYLDPQWVQPNTNGTRNWGVFQISEFRLRQFRATPVQALDPEWNIQAAHQLWKTRPDFGDWPNCARAAGIPRAASPSASG